VYNDYITGHITGESWVDSRYSQEVFSPLPNFQTRSVGPYTKAALSSGAKRPRRKARNSPPSSAEFSGLMAWTATTLPLNLCSNFDQSSSYSILTLRSKCTGLEGLIPRFPRRDRQAINTKNYVPSASSWGPGSITCETTRVNWIPSWILCRGNPAQCVSAELEMKTCYFTIISKLS